MERRQRRTATDGNEKTSKSFVCHQPGCGKRFTRLEHQRRHEYNHGIGDATCPRCSAHFKRPDLLERHLNRHRQRDEEAGGEGHGILNTRKRSWKAPDGSVVQKKPLAEGQQARNQTSQTHKDDSGVPISPPASTGHSEVEHYQDFQQEQQDDPNLLLDGGSWSASNVGSIEHPYPNVQENFWIDSGLLVPGVSAPTQPFAALPFDEVFQPDTASSFNMPYTTAANYNWLFEQNNNVFETLTNQCAMDVDPDFQLEQPLMPNQTTYSVTTASYQSSQEHSSPDPAIFDFDKHSGNLHAQLVTPTSSVTTSSPRRGRMSSIVAPEQEARTTDGNQPRFATPKPTTTTPSIQYDLERPLSTLRKPNLPVIQDDARDRLLEIIDVSQPSVPIGGPFNAWDHQLLSLPALQDCMNLFFTRFNTTYPLIHCATFDPSRAEALLLLSIILLGATYSTRDAHQLAVCIHDVVRPQIFAHAGFGSKPELWVLQTILLVECFGKSRAGQKQHDMSHLFHGLLINLIRRSDCQTVQTAPFRKFPSEKDKLETYWRQWAEAEEKKRLALLCFMWDTQHAVLFCQSLCMSAFELRLSMPCSQMLWEATDGVTWRHGQSISPQSEVSYLTALKTYLFNPGSRRPTDLDSFSRILVLHGLMSIAWDLERRDQTALGVVSFVGGVNWRNRLGDAYDLWKADFDSYCAEHVIKQRQQSQAPSNEPADWNAARREFATFSTAYNAIYHAAHILLNSSFLDVQIYAGSRHILGRPIRRGDYIRSEKIVKRWTSGADEPVASHTSSEVGSMSQDQTASTAAAKAAYNAACMLREASTDLDGFDSMDIIHLPWCHYLATLTLWAFHHARPSKWGNNEDESGEMVWDARKEMDDLLSTMASAKPWTLDSTCSRSTGALVWIMAEALGKVRWGIVHSGVIVLKALIPMRLIGQYEAM